MKVPVQAQMEDDALVEAIQLGNDQAFCVLLDRHVNHIRAFLALKAPVPHLIDELAHETFVFAFRNIKQFKAGTSVQAWLRAVAWNLLRSEIQRFSREQANQARFAAQHICANTLAAQEPASARELEHLERCLERVPDHLRELLMLKYQQEVAVEEISHQLRRTASWVYTSLFRVRQQLKQCIEQKLRGQEL